MDRAPWQRQKGESRQAFEAFTVYRDFGPTRSQEKVAKKLGKSNALMSRWSIKWNWVERAVSWDEELDRRNREAQAEARKEMAERHINESMMFQQKVLERLRELNPQELSPNDMARWFEIAVKVERLSRGETTENTKQDIQGQVEVKNDVAKRVIHDPQASALAHRLLERIAENDARGTSVPCESGKMDTR